MENKESGIPAKPSSICEKLFNALHLNPTFRPLRRIAYHSQQPVAMAATTPASPPPVPMAAGDGPAPPASKSSSLGWSDGAAVVPARQLSEKRATESRLPKVDSDSLGDLSKVERPARVTSAKPSYVEPLPPPHPSESQTRRVPSSSGKAPTPNSAPTPPPLQAVSNTDSTAGGANPPPAAEVGRTGTRRNLNQKLDGYINRTVNRLRTGSNVGRHSSSSQ